MEGNEFELGVFISSTMGTAQCGLVIPTAIAKLKVFTPDCEESFGERKTWFEFS